MGLNWYLEILGWGLGTDTEGSWWQVVADCINMLQVRVRIVDMHTADILAGCLGLPELCISEEGGQGHQEEAEVHLPDKGDKEYLTFIVYKDYKPME